MTRDQVLLDAYSRLTSRRLWLALLAIGFACFGYHNGALTAVELQTSVTAAVVAYLASEGLSDAATALRGPSVTVEPIAGQLLEAADPTPRIATALADELDARRAARVDARLHTLAGSPSPSDAGGLAASPAETAPSPLASAAPVGGG